MPVKTFVWNPLTDNVVKEKDGAGQTTAVYTHEPGLYGKLISQRRNGQSYQYHYDGQGSTRQLTDESQNVTDEYIYTAFGETVAQSGTTENPYRYVGSVGYHTDSESSNVYVRRRFYRPTVSQWLSLDPAVVLQSLGRIVLRSYIYANNSPTDLLDPTGRAAKRVVPSEWRTAGFILAPLGGIFGLTVPSDAYVECRCQRAFCDSFGRFEECPEDEVLLACRVVIVIGAIYIDSGAAETIRPGIYGHEILHVRNYHQIAEDVRTRLSASEASVGCTVRFACEATKEAVLTSEGAYLQGKIDDEVDHANYPEPAAGILYTGPGLVVPPPIRTLEELPANIAEMIENIRRDAEDED